MFIRKLALGLLVGISAAAASAAPLNAPATTDNANVPGQFDIFTATGSFTEGLTFTLQPNGPGYWSVEGTISGLGFDLSLLNGISIDGGAFIAGLNSPLSNSVFNFATDLAVGTHTITFDTTSSAQGASGTFSMTATTPVPEPETYAMMLAGLGAIGFMARRRKPK